MTPIRKHSKGEQLGGQFNGELRVLRSYLCRFVDFLFIAGNNHSANITTKKGKVPPKE